MFQDMNPIRCLLSNGVKKMIVISVAIIFFVGLDRFFKVFALSDQNQQFNLIGEVLKFNYKANYYMAFSLPLAGQALMVLIILIIIILILFGLYYGARQEYGRLVALFLIIFGASSNLFDRISYGYVIDYLDLKYFTVFNLADAMITIGVFLLLLNANKKKPAERLLL